MRLKKKEIINLPVYTQMGHHLGKVIDFELDSELQNIISYEVKSGDIFKEISGKGLKVAKEQVISITNVKMIVEDSVSRLGEKKLVKKAVPIN